MNVTLVSVQSSQRVTIVAIIAHPLKVRKIIFDAEPARGADKPERPGTDLQGNVLLGQGSPSLASLHTTRKAHAKRIR